MIVDHHVENLHIPFVTANHLLVASLSTYRKVLTNKGGSLAAESLITKWIQPKHNEQFCITNCTLGFEFKHRKAPRKDWSQKSLKTCAPFFHTATVINFQTTFEEACRLNFCFADSTSLTQKQWLPVHIQGQFEVTETFCEWKEIFLDKIHHDYLKQWKRPGTNLKKTSWKQITRK